MTMITILSDLLNIVALWILHDVLAVDFLGVLFEMVFTI